MFNNKNMKYLSINRTKQKSTTGNKIPQLLTRINRYIEDVK